MSTCWASKCACARYGFVLGWVESEREREEEVWFRKKRRKFRIIHPLNHPQSERAGGRAGVEAQYPCPPPRRHRAISKLSQRPRRRPRSESVSQAPARPLAPSLPPSLTKVHFKLKGITRRKRVDRVCLSVCSFPPSSVAQSVLSPASSHFHGGGGGGGGRRSLGIDEYS